LAKAWGENLQRLWHEVKAAANPSKQGVNTCCARLDEWDRLLPGLAGATDLLSHDDTTKMKEGLSSLWTHFVNLDKIEAFSQTLTSAAVAMKQWEDPSGWKARFKDLPVWTGNVPSTVLAAVREFSRTCVESAFSDQAPSNQRPSEWLEMASFVAASAGNESIAALKTMRDARSVSQSLSATRAAKQLANVAAKVKAIKAEIKIMEQASFDAAVLDKLPAGLESMGFSPEACKALETHVRRIVDQMRVVLADHHNARAQHTLKELVTAREELALVAAGGPKGQSWAAKVVDHTTLMAASQAFFDSFDPAVVERLCGKTKRASDTYSRAAALAMVDAQEVEKHVAEATLLTSKATATLNEACGRLGPCASRTFAGHARQP
jgi:hypothetical protein